MTEGELTHLGPDGAARMVDVSEKPETARRALAEGRIRMRPETLEALLAGQGPKGDVIATSRLAGIQACKRTGDLIPLCHILPGTSARVDIEPDLELPGFRVRAEVHHRGRTGVEMEALTAVSVALLTVYDMAKALDRDMVLGPVRLLEKDGGRSGSWRARGPEF